MKKMTNSRGGISIIKQDGNSKCFYLSNSYQLVKKYSIFKEIHQGTYITAIEQFIRRLTLVTYLLQLLVMTSKNIETKRYHGDIMNSMEAKICTTICYERKICKMVICKYDPPLHQICKFVTIRPS